MPKKVTTEDIITRFKAVHGNKYDYSLVNYINARNNVKIICKEHGEFEQNIQVHSKGGGCPKCGIKKLKNHLSMGLDKFIERSNKVHNNKYDYSKVNYTNSVDKICIICPTHGDFVINAGSHLRGNGCRLCNGKIYTKEQFLTKAKDVHGDRYDYSKVNFINVRTPVTIICTEHGEFEQTPTAHYNSSGCLKCAYGTPNLDKLIADFNKVHGNKYDYSLISTDNYENLLSVVPIICHDHGQFMQSAYNHKTGQVCRLCANENTANSMRDTYDDVINKFKEVHGDRYDYSLFTNYEGSGQTIDIICKTHGVFQQDVHNHIKFSGCSKCSASGPSKPEYKIKDFLDTNSIPYIHSDRKIIKPRELDFLLSESSVAIECNGAYWHSSKFIDKNYHLSKTLDCKDKNISLLHFWDFEINDKFDIVSSMILSKTNNIKNKLYARKCSIVEVKFNDSNIFLENNHLQGKCNSIIRLGLLYNNELVALMTFGKPRFNSKYEWELIRYCNKINYTVVGGASKIFKYFINNFYSGGSIVSYANMRYSDGGLYNNLNFVEVGSSRPSYFYNRGNDIISRYQAQKHKLEKLLGEDNFDYNLTEEQNMKNNGYYRVYDCGNLIYEYK